MSVAAVQKPRLMDPFAWIKSCWPHITLYDKQREIIESLRDNDETIVPAGNMLGKDFITALGILWFFVSRHPCRIVTTSVDATQLNAVLWGEIRAFLQTSEVGLTTDKGGPLLVNQELIRKVVRGSLCGKSYILGRVATDDGSGFLGHHIADTGDGIPRNLFVADEASAIPDMYFDKAATWHKRLLVIGNTFECENYFKRAVRAGDSYSEDGKRCYRKIICIRATDSPNVRYALAEQRHGREPSNRVVIPGVKTWEEYKKNLETWDEVKQSISLDARFYEGASVKLFPGDWLDRAQVLAKELKETTPWRKTKAIGVDTGQGGDDTVWTGVDDHGVTFQRVEKTPDTSVIPGITIGLLKEHRVEPENVLFDYGGGGKEHVDRLRAMRYNVRSVFFGERATDPTLLVDRVKSYRPDDSKIDEYETRTVFKNRRAEMYWMLRLLLQEGWAIPAEYPELIRQLRPIPLLYDGEGRMYMLPKNKNSTTSKEQTLTDLLGCSPDEADSTVLAVFGLKTRKHKMKAGAL